ncbi:MAG: acetylornithine carbamoyltransferase [Flavobacteriaceae bacterium]|nr:acetylornithine carbamoyltransferase [Flavobacteriaceae bacterium]
MKKFIQINDISNIRKAIDEALSLKKEPLQFSELGKSKRLVLLFFHTSLRTRLSTENAASNLGMQVSVLNPGDGWSLELQEGAVMNLDCQEHIKEAARVVSQYADIIGVRAFPKLKDKKADQLDSILNGFVKYASVPVINLECCNGHPLQALTDAITIEEEKKVSRPKIVLSWAPHPKALPHAVPESFIRCMRQIDADLTITHPKGLELDPETVGDVPICYNQTEALKDADFVYVKNWSSYSNYGKVIRDFDNWMMTSDKLGGAYFMHCLPIRRNVVAEDSVLDGNRSLVIKQANNRTFAAQVVLKRILEQL